MQIADIVIQKVSEFLKKDDMTCGTLYDVSIVYKSLIGLIGPSDDLMSLDEFRWLVTVGREVMSSSHIFIKDYGCN